MNLCVNVYAAPRRMENVNERNRERDEKRQRNRIFAFSSNVK